MNIELFFQKFNIMNLIDIIIVWLIVYRLLNLIKGTKAITILRGIGIVLVIKFISWYLNLSTISWITDLVINWAVVALVVVFQPEIRRGLEHLGRSTFVKPKAIVDNKIKIIEELDKAIQYMSKRHIGALITIQNEIGLEEYIETGIPINGVVTSQLLINTFIPNTPLHDGAVIIKNNELSVAAAYLPLSDNPTIPKEFGTRHRAAVGVSEVSDSVTIVVSEETGGITITKNSELMIDLNREEYLNYLNKQLLNKSSNDKHIFNNILYMFRKE